MNNNTFSSKSRKPHTTAVGNRLWTLGLLGIAGFFLLSAAAVAHAQPQWGQRTPQYEMPRFAEPAAQKPVNPWEDGLKYGAIGAVVGIVMSNQYQKKQAATAAAAAAAARLQTQS